MSKAIAIGNYIKDAYQDSIKVCTPLFTSKELHDEKPVFGVSNTNRAVDPQKMARGLKCQI